MTNVSETAPRKEYFPPLHRGEIALLGFLLICGAALRYIYLNELLSWPYVRELLLVGDGRVYHEAALRILREGPLSVSLPYQDPLYPTFLAVIMKISGSDLLGPLLFQSMLGLATAVLAWAIGRGMAGTLAGLVAAGAVALSPVAIYYESLIEKSAPCIFLFAMATWLMASGIAKGSGRRIVAAGAALALASLLRGNIFLVLPVAMLAIALARPYGMRRTAGMVALAAGICLVFVPVTARNRVAKGAWEITSGQGGANFWIGNNSLNRTGSYVHVAFVRDDPRFEERDWKAEAERRSGRQLTRSEVSRFWFGEGLAFWLDEPGVAGKSLMRKVLVYLSEVELPDTHAYPFFRDRFMPRYWALPGMNLLVPLSMVGVILSLRTWRTRIGELALFVGYAASVVLFFVLGRYRIVALPLFAAFAGVGIAGMVSFIKEREFLWLTIAIAAVAAAFGIAKRGDFSEKYAFPYFNISHALVQGGRYEEAEKLLPLGLEIDPWSPLGLELKGLLALERGDLEDADEALTASLEIPPTRTSALLALARVREKQGQIAEAAGLLEGILEVDPFNESARRQLKALRNFGGRR